MVKLRNRGWWLMWSVLALALTLLPSVASAGEGALGKWKLDLEGPQGAVEAVVEITEADGGLAGTWTGPRGSSELENVTFTDSTLRFDRKLSGPQGELTLQFEGKVDGDTLDGKLITPRGERPVKGSRVE